MHGATIRFMKKRWKDTTATTRVFRCELHLSVSRLDKRRAMANSIMREFVYRLSAS